MPGEKWFYKSKESTPRTPVERAEKSVEDWEKIYKFFRQFSKDAEIIAKIETLINYAEKDLPTEGWGREHRQLKFGGQLTELLKKAEKEVRETGKLSDATLGQLDSDYRFVKEELAKQGKELTESDAPRY